MNLYQFQNLSQKMDELGYPKIDKTSGFQTIRVDFKEAYNSGKIQFKDDGIYLAHGDKSWRGYMYMPTYRVSKYNSFSRFHLTKCSVIEKFINGGMFNFYYKWSNHDLNDITDRDTGHIYKDKKLNLCSRCVEELMDGEILDTEDFFNSLEKEEKEEQEIEVDIFGYVRGKEKISKTYRLEMEYTCEQCGVKCKNNMHRRWWHTHHKDGDKTNNRKSNLECLCIGCHSQKDVIHQNNFNNTKWKNQIAFFVKTYYDDLKELNSPLIYFI